jgi:AraC-like DNA-binding protein
LSTLSTLQQPLQKCIQEGKIEDAMVLLSTYFLSFHAQLSPDTMLYKAGIAMRKAKGIMPVAQIAEAAHATVRTLERKFKQSSGFTVKDVTNIMRFEQVNHCGFTLRVILLVWLMTLDIPIKLI